MRATLLFALLLLLIACAESQRPLHESAGLEPAVAAKLDAAFQRVASDPSAADWKSYGIVLHAHGLDEAATEAYGYAIAETPEFELVYLSGVARSGHDPLGALAHFELALALRDDYPPLYFRLALLEERADRLDAAETLYRKALEFGPSAHASLGLGRIELARGQARTALPHLLQARARAPKMREACEALARAYHATGDEVQARRAAAAARRTLGHLPFPDAYMEQVHAEGVSFTSVLARARALGEAGQLVPALGLVDEALLVRPGSPDALLARGVLLSEAKRHDEALPALERVLAKRPRDPQVLALFARSLAAVGRTDEALSHFERAHTVAPQDPMATAGLARLLRRNDPDRALGLTRELLTTDPLNRDAQLLFADLLNRTGRNADADAYLSAVLNAGGDAGAARKALDAVAE